MLLVCIKMYIIENKLAI